MAVQKINYQDKVALNENASIADINKCNASDLNEIKYAINSNADELTNLQPVELFSGASSGPITLSDSIANYKVIEISASNVSGDELFPIQRFYTNNQSSTVILFNASFNVNGGCYCAGQHIDINGTSLLFNYWYSVLLTPNSYPRNLPTTTNVKILKIVGYK